MNPPCSIFHYMYSHSHLEGRTCFLILGIQVSIDSLGIGQEDSIHSLRLDSHRLHDNQVRCPYISYFDRIQFLIRKIVRKIHSAYLSAMARKSFLCVIDTYRSSQDDIGYYGFKKKVMHGTVHLFPLTNSLHRQACLRNFPDIPDPYTLSMVLVRHNCIFIVLSTLDSQP